MKLYPELAKCCPVFGENYVQEYRDKQELFGNHKSHLIGPLQRNKAKDALKLFDCIETVHSEALAKELEKQATKIDKEIDILLQINISSDPNKSGFIADEISPVIEGWKEKYPHLLLKGAMTITAHYQEAAASRNDFVAFRKEVTVLFENHTTSFSVDSPEISMGMSGDFEIAIEEGATIIRVGSALFGTRAET